jgi:hypothetical protein
MEKALPRIDVDRADDAFCDVAEVGREVEEQIDARGDEQHAAKGALDRDQAKDETCPRRVAGAHLESL